MHSGLQSVHPRMGGAAAVGGISACGLTATLSGRSADPSAAATVAGTLAAARPWPARPRVLAVVDNSNGHFCCLADKLARLCGDEMVLDVVFIESYREFCTYVDVMGVHRPEPSLADGEGGGGTASESVDAAPGIDGLRAVLADRGLTGRVDVRSLGWRDSGALFDGRVPVVQYDLVLFDDQAPAPFPRSGGNAQRLATTAGVPAIQVRRCAGSGSGPAHGAALSEGADRSALMVLWPGDSASGPLLDFLSRYAGSFSAVVVWTDSAAGIGEAAQAAVRDSVGGAGSAIPVEFHSNQRRLWNTDLKAAIDRYDVGSVFLASPGRASVATLWQKIRLGFLSARGDLSKIYLRA